MTKDLSLVVWKTPEEGLNLFEQASAQESIAIRRVPNKEAFLVGQNAVVSLVTLAIKRSTRDILMPGYQAKALVRDAEGNLALGAVLYEGIDPGYCLRFAAGNTKTRWEERSSRPGILKVA